MSKSQDFRHFARSSAAFRHFDTGVQVSHCADSRSFANAVSRSNNMRVAVVGSGKVGRAVVEFLTATGDYRVTAVDTSEESLATFAGRDGIATRRLADGSLAALEGALAGHDAVISAVPFHATATVAEAAVNQNLHYLDLTEDVGVTQAVSRLAARAQRALIPQCGLAPGLISIVGMDLARRFEQLDTLRLRVGALPQFPSNAFGYNLTWSTDGVINEYIKPCEAIVDGRLVEVPALEGLEHFGLDGIAYEAFNTSGGLGSLCTALAGRVRTLDYRTIRYPGHRDAMRLLLDDLRFRERPEELRTILERALPATQQDVVVVFATATGVREGRAWQDSYVARVPAREYAGRWRTAIELTTAAAICAVLDLLHEGRIAQQGLVHQEQIPLQDFLDNRFGKVYADAARPVGNLSRARLEAAA